MQQTLRVELGDWEGAQRWAEYSHFLVGDAESQYDLRSLGTYSGDAGDTDSF